MTDSRHRRSNNRRRGARTDAAGALPDWTQYLDTFHSERAGITEDVLEHARDARGRTPYDWAAQTVAAHLPVPAGAPVERVARLLDLACGSAPMASHLQAVAYLGLDLSAAELAQARDRDVAVVQADAACLPVPDACVDAVVVSMALMLVPLQRTLAEVGRVLRPGGVLVATVPHNRPMPVRDWLRYARLCVALRHAGLRYPNDLALRNPSPVFASAGLTLQRDSACAFVCELGDAHVAGQLLASLYLPDVDPARLHAGLRVVHGWAGSSVTVPLRLLVARRQTGLRSTDTPSTSAWPS